MSYKYFGKLVGTTQAADSQKDTSPANTTTPFNPQAPATKFMAYGEDATSAAFNRAFSALSTNIDHIKGALDAPALRQEVLSPLRTSSDNPTTGIGFQSLSAHDSVSNPDGISSNQEFVDLAATNGDPNGAPPVWVYVGLHKEDLRKYFRLYGAKEDETIYGSRTDISSKIILRPNSAKVSAGAVVDYFPATTYWGDDKQGLPYKIPPISDIQTGLAPYNGSSSSQPIFKWSTDGLLIRSSGASFSDLFLRPGCYVEVVNDGDPTSPNSSNNGLYQIAHVSHSDDVGVGAVGGDKAVLTRGNLTKVTVGDYTTYEPGDLVCWKSYPDHNNAASAPEDRTNYAHVVRIIPREDVTPYADVGDIPGDLYLAKIGASEDFLGGKADVQGFQSGGRRSYGDVGLPDAEEGAHENWVMPKKQPTVDGTYLFRYNGMAWEYEEVSEVVAPSAPVSFLLDKKPGQLIPCNPLGFLLNPTLVFEPGQRPVRGDYYAHCHTLTTVGEQLRSKGASAVRGSFEDPGVAERFNQGDMRAITDLARHMRMGYSQWKPPAQGNSQFADYFTPTRMTLGSDLWYLEMEAVGGGAPDYETTSRTQGFNEGDTCVPLIHPDGVKTATGTIVSLGGNFVLLRMVGDSTQGYTHNFSTVDTGQIILGEAETTSEGWFGGASSSHTIGATTYKVKQVWSGSKAVSQSGNTYTPTIGLNAAFHNDYDANPYARGQHAQGHWIHYLNGSDTFTLPQGGIGNHLRLGKPLTVLANDDLVGGATQSGFRVRGQSDAVSGRSVSLIEFVGRDMNAALGASVELHSHQTAYTGNNTNTHASPGYSRSLTFFDECTLTDPYNFQLGRGAYSGIPLTSPDAAADYREISKPGADGEGYLVHGGTSRAFSGRSMPEETVQVTEHRVSALGSTMGPSIAEAVEAAIPGSHNPDLTGTYQMDQFGVWSNGLLHGGALSWWENDQDVRGGVYGYGANDKDIIDVQEAWYLRGGAKVFIPETRISVPAGSASGTYFLYLRFGNSASVAAEATRYVILDEGTATASDQSNYHWDSADTILLGAMAYDGANDTIVQLVECQQRVARQDKKGHIYVGNAGHELWSGGAPAQHAMGMYPGTQTHFKSLGEALAALKVWEWLRSQHTDNGNEQGRAFWTIEVVSWTIEVEDDARGLSYPYEIPCDGLTIQGAPLRGAPDFTPRPVIYWGFDPGAPIKEQNLITLNHRSGLTFRNLSFTWRKAVGMDNVAVNAVAPADPLYADHPGVNLFINRVVSTNVNESYGRIFPIPVPYGLDPVSGGLYGNGGGTDILIENVHLRGGTGFFFHTDIPNMDNLTIRDCTATEITNTFVTLSPSTQDPMQGAGGTIDIGYHRNVIIENCKASCYETSNPTTGVEILYCDAIRLDCVVDFRVSNCTITGFGRGVHCDTNYGTAAPYGNQMVDSCGIIENCNLNQQWYSGIAWFTSGVISAVHNEGGVVITGNVIKDWARERSGGNPSGWDLYATRPAIVTIAHDTRIEGNHLFRMQAPGTDWDAIPTSNVDLHYGIVAGGFGLYGPGTPRAHNVQVLSNKASWLPGHNFISLSSTFGGVVSGNIEDCGERTNTGSVYDWNNIHFHETLYTPNVVPGNHSFHGIDLSNITISDNVFASRPEYGGWLTGYWPCGEIRNTANIWGGYNLHGTKNDYGWSAYCEAFNHQIIGNHFSGISLYLMEAEGISYRTQVHDNQFGALRSAIYISTGTHEHQGGSIYCSANYTAPMGSSRGWQNNISICNNMTGGGGIFVAEDAILPGYPYNIDQPASSAATELSENRKVAPRHQYLTIRGNDLMDLRDQTIDGYEQCWEQTMSKFTHNGGYISVGGFFREVSITDNLCGGINLGSTEYVVDGEFYGPFPNCDYPDLQHPIGMVDMTVNQLPGWGQISGNHLHGNSIQSRGHSVHITNNMAVHEIMHNTRPAYPLEGTLNYTDTTMSNSQADQCRISGNDFILPLAFHEEELFGFPTDYWGTGIWVSSGDNVEISNNTNVKIISGWNLKKAKILHNNMSCSRSGSWGAQWYGDYVDMSGDGVVDTFTPGRYGIVLGYHGMIRLRGYCSDPELGGNNLLSGLGGGGLQHGFAHNLAGAASLNRLPGDSFNNPDPSTDGGIHAISPLITGFTHDERPIVPPPDFPPQNNANPTVEEQWYHIHQGWVNYWTGTIKVGLDRWGVGRMDRARIHDNVFMSLEFDGFNDWPDRHEAAMDWSVTSNVAYQNQWWSSIWSQRAINDPNEWYVGRGWFNVYTQGLVLSGNTAWAGMLVGPPHQYYDDGGYFTLTPDLDSGAYASITGNRFPGGGDMHGYYGSQYWNPDYLRTKQRVNITSGAVTMAANNYADWNVIYGKDTEDNTGWGDGRSCDGYLPIAMIGQGGSLVENEHPGHARRKIQVGRDPYMYPGSGGIGTTHQFHFRHHAGVTSIGELGDKIMHMDYSMPKNGFWINDALGGNPSAEQGARENCLAIGIAGVYNPPGDPTINGNGSAGWREGWYNINSPQALPLIGATNFWIGHENPQLNG